MHVWKLEEGNQEIPALPYRDPRCDSSLRRASKQGFLAEGHRSPAMCRGLKSLWETNQQLARAQQPPRRRSEGYFYDNL
jgi:hypothetical protein